MYLIMVYDINEKRVNKVLKISRMYLTWVQNSVLEGEITSARFERLKSDLKEVINEEEDSIIFYILRTTKYSKREFMGTRKNVQDIVL